MQARTRSGHRSDSVLIVIVAALAAVPVAPRVRARNLGIIVGTLPRGPLNAITDVAGVLVGRATIIQGKGPLKIGECPVRTGHSSESDLHFRLTPRRTPWGQHNPTGTLE